MLELNGNVCIYVQFRNELFYLPLMYIIKALVMQSDQSIYQHFIRGRAKDLFWAGIFLVNIHSFWKLQKSCFWHCILLVEGNFMFCISGCVSSMLLCCQEDGIRDQESALIALGSRFRVTLEDRIGSWETDQVFISFFFFILTILIISDIPLPIRLVTRVRRL